MIVSLLELTTKANELKRKLAKAKTAGDWQTIREELGKIEAQIETWGTQSNAVYRIM